MIKRHQSDRRAEMQHCTQEMTGSQGSCWPSGGDINGIKCVFNVGHQKCPQLYSCKFHPQWFYILNQVREHVWREKYYSHFTARVSLACNMLRLVGARSTEWERAKLCTTMLISAPWCAEDSWSYKIPWRRASPPENLFIFFYSIILAFPVSLTSLVCSPHWHTYAFITTPGSGWEEVYTISPVVLWEICCQIPVLIRLTFQTELFIDI